jgi:hypothetical protein
MSALPPKADIAAGQIDVRFVPKADMRLLPSPMHPFFILAFLRDFILFGVCRSHRLHVNDFSTDQTFNELRSGKCRSNRSKPLLLNDGLSNTSKGGKNENVTSSSVLVRTHFYPVRMACMVRWASDGNGKASACKY